MARFRLSTDILSPLNSDISLNDGSAFSFGSLPGTPVFDSTFPSPICSGNTKDTDISLLCQKHMKECDKAFGEITNAIKKQSNSEREEKYQETYADLKKSMDDLFGKNSNSSVTSPQLKNDGSKDGYHKLEVHYKKNAVGELPDSKNPKLKKNRCPDSKNISDNTEKKLENYKKEKSVTNKLKKNQHQPKQTSVSESVKGPKNEARVRNDTAVNEKKEASFNQKKNSKSISSTKNDEPSFLEQHKGTSSKIFPEKQMEKGTEFVKKYNFKCQKKISVPNSKPIVEQKSLSIEKSIHLAISMEMDNLRRSVLNQNLSMHKDLLKLQEMIKKPNEVTSYLFSVIDELLDTNKKLISKFD